MDFEENTYHIQHNIFINRASHLVSSVRNVAGLVLVFILVHVHALVVILVAVVVLLVVHGRRRLWRILWRPGVADLVVPRSLAAGVLRPGAGHLAPVQPARAGALLVVAVVAHEVGGALGRVRLEAGLAARVGGGGQVGHQAVGLLLDAEVAHHGARRSVALKNSLNTRLLGFKPLFAQNLQLWKQILSRIIKFARTHRKPAQSPVDGPEEGVLFTAAAVGKVIQVEGPDHATSKTHLLDVLCLVGNCVNVIKSDPLVPLESIWAHAALGISDKLPALVLDLVTNLKYEKR